MAIAWHNCTGICWAIALEPFLWFWVEFVAQYQRIIVEILLKIFFLLLIAERWPSSLILLSFAQKSCQSHKKNLIINIRKDFLAHYLTNEKCNHHKSMMSKRILFWGEVNHLLLWKSNINRVRKWKW